MTCWSLQDSRCRLRTLRLCLGGHRSCLRDMVTRKSTRQDNMSHLHICQWLRGSCSRFQRDMVTRKSIKVGRRTRWRMP